jgi:hypothetical protein
MRALKFGLASVLVVGTLAALLVTGTALAQNNTQSESAAVTPMGRGGYGMAAGMCGQAGVDAAARALGLTTDEMRTQLWGGRTLADLADRAGVELQAVQDAVKNACKEQLRAAVEQAVTDGKLTREKADWLLEGLDKGFWGEPGEGFGLGGFMGPRGFGRDDDKSFGRFMGPQGFWGDDQGQWGPGRGPGGMGMGRWGGQQPGPQGDQQPGPQAPNNQ